MKRRWSRTSRVGELLASREAATDGDLQNAVVSWLNPRVTDFLQVGRQAVVATVGRYCVPKSSYVAHASLYESSPSRRSACYLFLSTFVQGAKT
jgi:hypothetical protein